MKTFRSRRSSNPRFRVGIVQHGHEQVGTRAVLITDWSSVRGFVIFNIGDGNIRVKGQEIRRLR
jgi:hypothetical protein